MIGKKAWQVAAAKGYESVVELLLGKEAKLDIDDLTGKEILFAAEKGYAKIVEVLLKKGAEPNVQDNDRRTALHLAALGGYKG
jgi:uncharacterized protein